MHSLLIVGLVLLVRVIKVMELPVKHYEVGKILRFLISKLGNLILLTVRAPS